MMTLVALLGVLAMKVSYQNQINECIQRTHDQIELYGDLCAESSSGYEEMNSLDARYDGVICSSEAIRWCLEEIN